MKYMSLLFLVLSGCASANLISTRYNPRSGIVEYKNNDKSEEKARQIAADFCGGDFKTLGIDSSSQVGAYQYTNGMAVPLYRNRNQLVFECL